jgi:EmrB/QacA subfamily drug resistance transporter
LEERRRTLILIAATAGAIMVPLNTSMVSVALAPIMTAFGLTVAQATWLVLLYLVVITSLQPTAGKLGDRFGHRRVFLAGLLFFGLASVGAALAPAFWVLVLCRVLQGFTASTLGPNAAALIRLAYPIERQGQAMGLYVGIFSMGLTVGPVLGGLLVNWVGWQGIFWVNVPTVMLSALIGFMVLPTANAAQKVPFDWGGTALFGGLVAGIVLVANTSKTGGLPVPMWVMIPVLAALALGLYRQEGRAEDPLIKFSLFRSRGFSASNLSIFLTNTMVYVVLVALPLYLQSGRGLSAAASGVQMALFSAMQLVAPVAGRLSDRWGRQVPVLIGGGLFLAGWAGLLLVTQGSSLVWVTVPLLLAGTGYGLTQAPIQAACLSALPRADVGVGSGVWYSSRYLGNVAGALFSSLLLPHELAQGAPVLWWTQVAVAVALMASARLLPAHGEELAAAD